MNFLFTIVVFLGVCLNSVATAPIKDDTIVSRDDAISIVENTLNLSNTKTLAWIQEFYNKMNKEAEGIAQANPESEYSRALQWLNYYHTQSMFKEYAVARKLASGIRSAAESWLDSAKSHNIDEAYFIKNLLEYVLYHHLSVASKQVHTINSSEWEKIYNLIDFYLGKFENSGKPTDGYDKFAEWAQKITEAHHDEEGEEESDSYNELYMQSLLENMEPVKAESLRKVVEAQKGTNLIVTPDKVEEFVEEFVPIDFKSELETLKQTLDSGELSWN